MMSDPKIDPERIKKWKANIVPVPSAERLKGKGSSPSPCSAPIVPLGTVLPCGTVAGVQFMQGERYYFTTGEGVGYLPADIVEKQYSEQNSREQERL